MMTQTSVLSPIATHRTRQVGGEAKRLAACFRSAPHELRNVRTCGALESARAPPSVSHRPPAPAHAPTGVRGGSPQNHRSPHAAPSHPHRRRVPGRAGRRRTRRDGHVPLLPLPPLPVLQGDWLAQQDTQTRLTVTVSESGNPAANGTFELECGPAGGSHLAAQRACDLLDEAAKSGENPFVPTDRNAMCTMQAGGPAAARVSGTWQGRTSTRGSAAPTDARSRAGTTSCRCCRRPGSHRSAADHLVEPSVDRPVAHGRFHEST